MGQYRIIQKPLFLMEGIVSLTKAQAGPRKHLIKNIKKGVYEIRGEVCFKVGEVIGIDERYAKPLLKFGYIEHKNKKDAEEKARKEAEERAKKKAEEKAEKEAEKKAKEEAEQGALNKIKDFLTGKDNDAEKLSDR